MLRPGLSADSAVATVVILGRPNVGKSTLFNRMVGYRKALVHDEPGVTRDRIEEMTEWWHEGNPYAIKLIDTGGLGGDRFAQEIRHQVDVALQEATIGLFVLDGALGLTPADHELFRELKRQGVLDRIPVLGVVNKIDAAVHEDRVQEFYRLGFDGLLGASAEHGRGMDEIQAWVFEKVQPSIDASLPRVDEKAIRRKKRAKSEKVAKSKTGPKENIETLDRNALKILTDIEMEEQSAEEAALEARFQVPRLAIVGKPNVGKSTLMNAILGENRVVVSPIAGTTVDSIEQKTELGGKPVILIDTAGMRRKSKTEQGIEVLSVVQTRKALERSSIALLMIDGTEGPTDQDEKIAGIIEEVGCSVILAVNKWDLAETGFKPEQAAERIRSQMRFLNYAPIVFISAKKKRGLDRLGELMEEILHSRKLRIPTHEFTEWVRKEIEIHNPANAKFYLSHQSGRNPPTFVCHVNDPKKVHFSLTRHLVNALRERWGYMGTPVRLLILEAKNRRSLPRQHQTGARGPKKSG